MRAAIGRDLDAFDGLLAGPGEAADDDRARAAALLWSSGAVRVDFTGMPSITSSSAGRAGRAGRQRVLRIAVARDS